MISLKSLRLTRNYLHGHFYRGLDHSLLLEQGMINLRRWMSGIWIKVIIKKPFSNPVLRETAYLLHCRSQSVKQLELGFIILVHSSESRKHICCFHPMKKAGQSNIKLKWLNNIACTVCYWSAIAIYCTDVAARRCLQQVIFVFLSHHY